MWPVPGDDALTRSGQFMELGRRRLSPTTAMGGTQVYPHIILNATSAPPNLLAPLFIGWRVAAR